MAFRRRRSRGGGSRRRGVAPWRDKNWVHFFNDGVESNANEVAALELLTPSQYRGADDAERQDHCTVARIVGSMTFDVGVDPQQAFNSAVIFAQIAVVSEQYVADAFLVNPNGSQLDPRLTLANTNYRVLHQFPIEVQTTALHINPDSITDVIIDWAMPTTMKWDITQRARLRTDEGLWLFVVADITFPVDEGELNPLPWTAQVQNRTLILD